MPTPKESTTARTVHVDLPDRTYPIYIGEEVAQQSGVFKRHITGRQVLLVTNETIGPLLQDRIAPSMEGFDWDIVTLPDGEQYKTLETAATIYDTLLEKRFDRSCTLIALGGGVVGDITGFVAATYQRGVAFIQVPTTLLALVDSSVGGKTGVNHPLGKNMIGAFHQPRCVIADTNLLATLPDREFRAGIAEVIKYGLIQDYAFFQWLERNMGKLLAREPGAVAYVIEESCRNKARVVAADERESGQRALLNLGHTFGHAIETWTNYSEWLHGEAVAAGMCMAAQLSTELGWMGNKACQRVEQLIEAAELPTTPPPIPAEDFRRLMAVDKKAQAGKLRLVLLEGIGNSIVTSDFDDNALTRTLARYAPANNAETE